MACDKVKHAAATAELNGCLAMNRKPSLHHWATKVTFLLLNSVDPQALIHLKIARTRKRLVSCLIGARHRYLLTPWSRVLPEKLKGPELLKKFPAFYGTRRFITAFTRARHLSLSWARLIQSTPPIQPLAGLFNIILPTTPGSSKWSPSFRFPH
jgi:hypothetical protein